MSDLSTLNIPNAFGLWNSSCTSSFTVPVNPLNNLNCLINFDKSIHDYLILENNIKNIKIIYPQKAFFLKNLVRIFLS